LKYKLGDKFIRYYHEQIPDFAEISEVTNDGGYRVFIDFGGHYGYSERLYDNCKQLEEDAFILLTPLLKALV
jgi:hypothetical protein